MGEMNESYVIVLYTGGTIGMKSVRTDNEEGVWVVCENMFTLSTVYRPEKNYMTNALRSIPHLNDAQYVKDNFAQVGTCVLQNWECAMLDERSSVLSAANPSLSAAHCLLVA